MMERKWKLQFKVFGLGFMLGTASTLYQSVTILKVLSNYYRVGANRNNHIENI